MGERSTSFVFNAASVRVPDATCPPVFTTNPAVGGGARLAVDRKGAFPSSSFAFAGREPPDKVAFKLTGLPPGDPGNHPRALYQRDTAAGLSHNACHMLVLTHGGIVEDPKHLRPLNQAPQAVPGQNGGCLAVYLEGDRHITPSQMGAVQELAATLENVTRQPVAVIPASYKESLALSSSGPALTQPRATLGVLLPRVSLGMSRA